MHRNVCLSSIFVDSAGEWKLAGVEFMIPHSETNPPPKILTSLKKYDPPETGKPGAAKKGEKWWEFKTTIILVPNVQVQYFYNHLESPEKALSDGIFC